MIVILHDQFLHLEKGILPAFRHVFGNIGNLRPYDHAISVAQVIKILIVLIMRKAYRICPDLTDQLHVFFHLLIRNRVAASLIVLMPGNAVKRIGNTV